MIPDYGRAFLETVANEYEEKIFVCPDPAYNSDANFTDDGCPVERYQDQCHWQTGNYGAATRKAIDDWTTMITP